MPDDLPKIDDEVLVTDDPLLAAEVSSFKNRKGFYFPVLDGPRMGRPDKESEVTRRTNTIARMRSKRVFLFNLEEEAREGFMRRIPSDRLIYINDKKEIDEVITTRQKSKKELIWGPSNIAIGLLKAKYNKARLRIIMQASPIENVITEGPHLVILEDVGDITSIIAANYAFSINASLVVIPPVPEADVDDVRESFYQVYSEKSYRPLAERLEVLRDRIRQFAPKIDISNYICVTFITTGLPWGFAFPEIPSTHISYYPDMGLALANAIVAEQRENPGIRVSLLIDPGDPSESETYSVMEFLGKKGSYVRCLCGRLATVNSVSLHVDVFPYDLLFISTHAGEISGRRLTYLFMDREGIERKLVVDIAAGFAVQPGSEMVKVTEFTRFVSLDDVKWDDPEKEKKLYVGSALIDFDEMKANNNPELRVLSNIEIPRVRACMALKMYDLDYIPLFHSVADHNSPIIFNNACSSWKEMSGRFIFAGARAYIGTLFDVTGLEAKEVAVSLFHRHGARFLPVALWRAQNDVYGKLRHPYIVLGPHFTRIRFDRSNNIKYLAVRLKEGIKKWHRLYESTEREDVKKNTSEYIAFLEKELSTFLERWFTKQKSSK